MGAQRKAFAVQFAKVYRQAREIAVGVDDRLVYQFGFVGDAAELALARSTVAEERADGVGTVAVGIRGVIRTAARDQGADAARKIGMHRGEVAGIESGIGMADHLPLAGEAPGGPCRDGMETRGGYGFVVAVPDFGTFLNPLYFAACGEIGDRTERQHGLYDAPVRTGAGRFDLAAQLAHNSGKRCGILGRQRLDRDTHRALFGECGDQRREEGLHLVAGQKLSGTLHLGDLLQGGERGRAQFCEDRIVGEESAY